jgi:hypothetical protein
MDQILTDERGLTVKQWVTQTLICTYILIKLQLDSIRQGQRHSADYSSQMVY